ncbi:GerMN domain-containing protein [Geodermatophilus sp. CPCC 206100]|uniref:GerMN domain-containing protein n=1 Tax=Geodermatophilus sp. CPCC 206100 TaxID=3020054 RepID=UPI003B008D6B
MSRRLLPALLCCLVAGCGVSTGGPAEEIPATDVPFGLTSPSPLPTPTAAPEPEASTGQVYLVAPDDRLVSRPREVTGPSLAGRLDALLERLAAGPTPTERDEQLSTALPPDVELAVADVTDGTVTVDLSGPADVPSGLASRRAVAQLVLSATSLPGVASVVLSLEGQRVDAPLPSGELTAQPLTAADYAVFQTPAPTPAATALPAPPS